MCFLLALVVKNPPANSGDIRDVGSIPGSGRFPGGRHGNPLQFSFLKNPMENEEMEPKQKQHSVVEVTGDGNTV